MSTQREITTPVPLLGKHGNLLVPGWSRRMNWVYDRQYVAGRPFGLKEWNFYQVGLGSHVLQLTIGHVSYVAQYSAILFDTDGGERHEFSRMTPLPMRRMNMPSSPDRINLVTATGRDFGMRFDTTRESHRLTVTVGGAEEPVDIDLILPRRGDDEMVIATPFDHPSQFYLNCKAMFHGVTGHARFGDTRIDATEETAIMDWGRGVWPFHQEWFWGAGAGQAEDRRFGFNIGWGFGDLSHATENMFFLDGTAYKLGQLHVERDEHDYMAPWRFCSDDESFDLTMTPFFDNDTATKIAFVDNRIHQVHGMFNGHVVADGKVVEVNDLRAFCEHAVNNW